MSSSRINNNGLSVWSSFSFGDEFRLISRRSFVETIFYVLHLNASGEPDGVENGLSAIRRASPLSQPGLINAEEIFQVRDRLLDCSTRMYGPRWGVTGDGDVIDIIGVFVPCDNWMDVYKDNN